MNQYYGSERVGKRRLAQLTESEKEASKDPLLGRSRAERLLDDSLIKLKKARHEQVDPFTGKSCGLSPETSSPASSNLMVKDQRGRYRIEGKKILCSTATSPIQNKKVKSNTDTQPTWADLINLTRRFEYRAKFARTVVLLHRLFSTGDGKQMLKTWKAAIEIGREQAVDDFQVQSVIEKALANKSWIIFYTCWTLATASHTCSSGDARELILRLYDSIWIDNKENSVIVSSPQTFSTNFTFDRIYKSLVAQTDVQCYLDEGTPSEVSRLEIDIEKATITTHNGHQKKAFFNEAWHWTWMYEYLLPVCRISALAHNLLYTDDPHIFHKGLRYLEATFQAIPNNYRQIDRNLMTYADEAVSSSEPLHWIVPNGFQILFFRKKMLFDSLPVVYKMHRQGWARTAVEQFFCMLYSERFSKFDDHEIDLITHWQSQVKETAKAATNSHRRVEPEIATVGESTMAVRDSRDEVISTVHGTEVWSDKQMV